MLRFDEKTKDRFWNKVNIPANVVTGCWEWLSSKDTKGYGRFSLSGLYIKSTGAHRVSYEIIKGSIPKGMVLDHTCYNPSCVNPEHLRAVTIRANCQNRAGKTTGKYSSKYPGVRWIKDKKCWRADAKINGKKKYIGFFPTEEEAYDAYRNAVHEVN